MFPTYDTVDLFAGPGGWSVAAQRLGLREMGIEYDQAAHLTRRANGHHTIRASVADFGPRHFPNATGLIASPPCPTFSAAGSGSGRRELDAVVAGLRSLASGAPVEHTWEDPRTGLTLVSLRNNTSANAAVRDASLPAPTMYFGARLNTMRWEASHGQQ